MKTYNTQNKQGIDAGGVSREWFAVLSRTLLAPETGLFTAIGDEGICQPSTNSVASTVPHLPAFKLTGRLVAKALIESQNLDIHFSRSFYKHILGHPVTFADLEATEPDFFKSMVAILEHPLEDLGLELTFSDEHRALGTTTVVDLVPGGHSLAVEDETKALYARLLTEYRTTAAIRDQTKAFLTGFYSVLDRSLVSIFDVHQLELLISGLPTVDIDDMRAHTSYHGYSASDPQITYLWNVLQNFSKVEKALFLQFVTGSSKVPLDGFKALRGNQGVQCMSVHKAFDTDRLPTAHTCFNQIVLPQYASEEVLREKLLIAVREGSEGFGFL